MTPLTASSMRRAWVALVLGVASMLTLPAAIEIARRSKRIGLLDTAYVIPVAFVLALLSLVMARRARHNLRWLPLSNGGTSIATAALLIATVALCLAVAAALSVGFYGLVVVYQHSR